MKNPRKQEILQLPYQGVGEELPGQSEIASNREFNGFSMKDVTQKIPTDQCVENAKHMFRRNQQNLKRTSYEAIDEI